MARRVEIMVKRIYLNMAVVTLLSAVIATGVTVYSSLTAVPATAVDALVKAPLNPNINLEVFNAVIAREDLGTLAFSASESATPVEINEITPSVIETEEAEALPSSEETETIPDEMTEEL